MKYVMSHGLGHDSKANLVGQKDLQMLSSFLIISWLPANLIKVFHFILIYLFKLVVGISTNSIPGKAHSKAAVGWPAASDMLFGSSIAVATVAAHK